MLKPGLDQPLRPAAIDIEGIVPISPQRQQKALKLFRKQNPGAEGKVFFDVASGTAVKLAKDAETGDLALVPATGVIDTEGEEMPEPNKGYKNNCAKCHKEIYGWC